MNDKQRKRTSENIAKKLLTDVRYDAQCANVSNAMNNRYIERLIIAIEKVFNAEQGFLFKEYYTNELTMGSSEKVEIIIRYYPLLKEIYEILNDYFDEIA